MTTATTVLDAASDTVSGSPSLGPLLMLGAVFAVAWLVGQARRARSARVCERHGHVPDPDAVGTWNERCRRCGARIR